MINNLDKLSQKEIQELFNRISLHIQDIKIPLDTDIQSNKNYFLKNCFFKKLTLFPFPSLRFSFVFVFVFYTIYYICI